MLGVRESWDTWSPGGGLFLLQDGELYLVDRQLSGDVETGGLGQHVLQPGLTEAGQLRLHGGHQLLQVGAEGDPGRQLQQQTDGHLDDDGHAALQEDEVEHPADEPQGEVGGEEGEEPRGGVQ